MVLQNDIDLLNPPADLEKRKHKLKRLVQSPNSFFMFPPIEQLDPSSAANQLDPTSTVFISSTHEVSHLPSNSSVIESSTQYWYMDGAVLREPPFSATHKLSWFAVTARQSCASLPVVVPD
ncbi:hypothetical protein KSS87_018413 [Heliosperma pusillum]|nr:hypothetical protein KSS87_018413 [Heliosperma pusillum]